jgi:hypothetical protein
MVRLEGQTNRRHCAGYNFSHSFNFVVDWGFTPMELQRRLGVCPIRRTHDRLNCDYNFVASRRDLKSGGMPNEWVRARTCRALTRELSQELLLQTTRIN